MEPKYLGNNARFFGEWNEDGQFEVLDTEKFVAEFCDQIGVFESEDDALDFLENHFPEEFAKPAVPGDILFELTDGSKYSSMYSISVECAQPVVDIKSVYVIVRNHEGDVLQKVRVTKNAGSNPIEIAHQVLVEMVNSKLYDRATYAGIEQLFDFYNKFFSK